MPVSAIGGSLIVAMVNPDDHSTVEELGVLTGLRIEVVSASAEELTESIEMCYREVS